MCCCYYSKSRIRRPSAGSRSVRDCKYAVYGPRVNPCALVGLEDLSNPARERADRPLGCKSAAFRKSGGRWREPLRLYKQVSVSRSLSLVSFRDSTLEKGKNTHETAKCLNLFDGCSICLPGWLRRERRAGARPCVHLSC